MTNAHSIEELVAELASWEATAAELRRQLAGSNALLATARAQRQAVLDLCHSPIMASPWGELISLVRIDRVRAALGVTGQEETPMPAPRNPFPKA